MTTSENTAKSPYRVEVTTWTPNPKYLRGSFAATTRHAEIQSKAFTFFETLEDAQAFAAANRGWVQALSATGKSYRPVR